MTPLSAALAASVLLNGASSTMLPSIQSDEARTSSFLNSSSWTVQVGGDIYYQPASLLGLSQNISHYYYARGSASAMTNEMRQRRVGGNDNWHIFHVPEGVSMIQSASMTAKQGDRRSSLSQLSQLRHGQKLMDTFPQYEVMDSYNDGLDETLRAQELAGAKTINTDLVSGYLQGLVNLGTRSYEDDSARTASEEHIKSMFEKINPDGRVCLQAFQKNSLREFNLHNVITYIDGEAEDDGFTVIGAHFDSRPYTGDAPGANDNGSGVAALLAVLKAFKAHNVKPKKPIYFVAFAAEEPGLWGSENFVRVLKEGSGYGMDRVCNEVALAQGPSVLARSFLRARSNLHNEDFQKSAAIILDEVGWVSSNLDKQTFNIETFDPVSGRDTRPIMEHVAAASAQLNTDALNEDSDDPAPMVVHSNNPFGSDHMSFLSANLPAGLLINGDDEGYPHYHQSTDAFEQVTESYLAKVARAAYGGLFRLAHAS